MIENMLRKLAEYQERHVYLVMLLFIVVTAFFGMGATMVSTEVSFEKEIPQDIEVIQTMFMIRDEFGGTSQISVMIMADDIRTALDGSSLVNEDYSITLVNARLGIDSSDKEKGTDIIEYTLNVLDDQPLPENTELRLAGLPYQEYSLINIMGSEMGKITLIAFVGIILITVIMFRNVLHGVTTIIPVGMAMFWTIGFAGYIGIAISTSLIGVLSMILGLGVDYSIHINHWN